MPSNFRVSVNLRLEDVVALTFFLLTFALRLLVRGFAHDEFSPSDVLVIIPAVTLLLAKELVHYFWMSGRETSPTPGANLRNFARPYWIILRDWFPFFVILLMYYSLWGDATHLLVAHDRDAALIAWDQRLFGFQASVALQRFVTPLLTAWMEFAYTFHILNIPIVACFVYLRRRRERFREMMAGVLVITFLGLVGYLLVPAVGPMYTLRDQFTVPLGVPLEVVNRQIEFMDFARIKRDVFPSLHAGISFVVWLYAWRNSRPLFAILAPFVLSLFVSTVYLRYHYLVDVVAGLLLAPFAFLLANWLFRRWGEIHFGLTLPGFLSGWAQRLGVSATSAGAGEKIEERS
ncbi:MAG: phosphatase PAP2 family protein [Terriglobia bacterium]|jgi:membrane-associated phospholipid phosphatase